MTYLFVDYNQGGGGEYLCSCLSQAPQCKTLNFHTFDSGRTKVQDVFNQEFLKPNPSTNLKIPPPSKKYLIVPTHRHTALAKKILKDIRSIRIQYPTQEYYFDYLKHQQINKVLLATEPTDFYFLGFLKILSEQYNNTNFLSRVNRSMDNLSLTLLAKNIEPTEEHRKQYLTNLQKFKIIPEPKFDYDLIIPYEKLCCQPELVADNIQQCFNIAVDVALLKKYQENFEQYQAQTQAFRY
jgi:hypothetical protein